MGLSIFNRAAVPCPRLSFFFMFVNFLKDILYICLLLPDLLGLHPFSYLKLRQMFSGIEGLEDVIITQSYRYLGHRNESNKHVAPDGLNMPKWGNLYECSKCNQEKGRLILVFADIAG